MHERKAATRQFALIGYPLNRSLLRAAAQQARPMEKSTAANGIAVAPPHVNRVDDV